MGPISLGTGFVKWLADKALCKTNPSSTEVVPTYSPIFLEHFPEPATNMSYPPCSSAENRSRARRFLGSCTSALEIQQATTIGSRNNRGLINGSTMIYCICRIFWNFRTSLQELCILQSQHFYMLSHLVHCSTWCCGCYVTITMENVLSQIDFRQISLQDLEKYVRWHVYRNSPAKH